MSTQEFMEQRGYKFYDDHLGTRGYSKLSMPPVYEETACEMHQLYIEGQIAAIRNLEAIGDPVLQEKHFDETIATLELALTELNKEA